MNPSKPYLVGECNPYGADPYFALYPRPEKASGYRLCALVLGMREFDYLGAFQRVNLLQTPRWSVPAARSAAVEFKARARISDRVVLLGQKVAAAFDPELRPFEACENLLYLPHPSGLCRAWDVPGAYARARAVVAAFLPEVAGLLGRI